MLRKAVLYYRTMRHLKPVQVFGRVLPEAKKRLVTAGLLPVSLPEAPEHSPCDLRPRVPFLLEDSWNTAANLRRGMFRFLNEERSLGWPPQWSDNALPILWNYNLHYFDYLHLLTPQEQSELCKAWIQENPVGRTVGWYPYPLALRIVNWCKAGSSERAIVESLYQQAVYLSRNMEIYHPGNHLLENAKALIVAARYFEGDARAASWMDTGLGIMRRELPKQVLSDGGYFERSPMYHAIMLEGFLDLCNVLPPRHRDRSLLADTARRMTDVLASTSHPDGHIALFNDSAQEIARSPAALLEYASKVLDYRPRISDTFEDTGYFVGRNDRVFLIVDGGAIGPDFIPAHAHADIFSFELSIDGVQFVVDSGTFDYVPGKLRSHLRSTPAHNTVCVDDVDQAECWKSHRVGRRFAPRDVATHRRNGQWSFQGTFDGYSNLIGDEIVHERKITIEDELSTISVLDHVHGYGRHRTESRLHFHPDVRVDRESDRLVLERDGKTAYVTGDDLDGWRLEESVYCPRFGVDLANTVLVIGGPRELPTSMSFEIHF